MIARRLFLHVLIAVTVTAISSCQPGSQPQDKLTEILDRGTLVVSTDPAYPPQSEIKPGAKRTPGTQCTFDQLTATELFGFDVRVALEIANRLGVEACFVTPDWSQITRGGWQDQWDISVGSMAITPERVQSLIFTQPYYATQATFFVHSDNTGYSNPGELMGKRVGTCAGCTYQKYLEGALRLPGQEIEILVENVEIVEYATEAMALQELAWGDGVRLDAVLIASPTGNRARSNGLQVRQLGEAVYSEYLSAAVDRNQKSDPNPFIDKLNEIIRQMHSDGTLRNLSMQFYSEDLTAAAAEFDIAVIQ